MLLELVVAAFALLNALTWGTYRLDKARAARGGWRISERTLLTLAAAGGSIGALVAVYGHRRRHKANKRAFMTALWVIVGVHATAAVALVYTAVVD